ncbi:winged helix-turn-helix domain-containing protein [Stagnihabitans tardus]|uniref:OmpR/PhoB-type domain-containing protein n=1 Tax=Stagnihabitans tardus TaxID=2699202 RepID=A0AAE4Y6D8_9RHOB|nr:hypothetical protein [Stagnihabitans tardus]
MPVNSSSVSDSLKAGQRVVAIGIGAVVAIVLAAALFVYLGLPDADAFNRSIERLFVESDLRDNAEIKLLEILAQSGTIFAEVQRTYLVVIFILMAFSAGLLVAVVVFLASIVTLNRRISLIQKSGIQVARMVVNRETRAVTINDHEFQLTDAALETLAVLAEARLDDEVLTGAQIEAVISGRAEHDCEEAAGATRIKRLRDALGNQLVAELLVKTVARRGYALSVGKDVIKMV